MQRAGNPAGQEPADNSEDNSRRKSAKDDKPFQLMDRSEGYLCRLPDQDRPAETGIVQISVAMGITG
ncbi:hypothetical protein D3C73_940530 [compost metagenome]